MQSPYKGLFPTCKAEARFTSSGFIADQFPDVIRSNVVAGKRPHLSDDDCPDRLKDLIIRCWDSKPDVRLSFRGEHLI